MPRPVGNNHCSGQLPYSEQLAQSTYLRRFTVSLRAAAEIKIEYLEWIEARKTVAKGQSYRLDTGQGSQTVTRADLTQINKTIEILKQEYEEATAEESGDSGIVAATLRRY